MGFPLWSEFANESHCEAGSSKQCNDQRTDKTAIFLAPIITDFIRNTKRELYDEKLEDTLEMIDLEWSKDNDTKTQCNRLNTSPLHRGNASNKNGPARVKRRMQWETPSKPLAVDDPLSMSGLRRRQLINYVPLVFYVCHRYENILSVLFFPSLSFLFGGRVGVWLLVAYTTNVNESCYIEMSHFTLMNEPSGN